MSNGCSSSQSWSSSHSHFQLEQQVSSSTFGANQRQRFSVAFFVFVLANAPEERAPSIWNLESRTWTMEYGLGSLVLILHRRPEFSASALEPCKASACSCWNEQHHQARPVSFCEFFHCEQPQELAPAGRTTPTCADDDDDRPTKRAQLAAREWRSAALGAIWPVRSEVRPGSRRETWPGFLWRPESAPYY